MVSSIVHGGAVSAARVRPSEDLLPSHGRGTAVSVVTVQHGVAQLYLPHGFVPSHGNVVIRS